jgi:lytic murein transglycosylase
MRLVPLLAALMAFAATPALAKSCGDPSGFPAWLEGIKKEAASQGIGARGLAALNGVTYDRNTISHDRGQKVFHQSFEEFSGRMVNSFRIKHGQALIQKYQPVFTRVEEEYGVQAPVIVSLWGLETDFGANIGNFQTIRSLATLSYDCRRPDKFRPELFDALRLVDRGDVAAAELHGAWAGELGQAQFMPSNYLKYAVDFEGRGHRDLLKSPPDVIASIANLLHAAGWQRGAGWEPGEPNFDVLQAWNNSELYRKTIALLATRIAGN